jgi:hypothetical protein
MHVQVEAPVAFYRRVREERRGEVELGAAQWREARPGQGRGKSAASPARRGLAVGNRRPHGACELDRGGIQGTANRRQQARSVAGRGPLFAPWRSSPVQPCRDASPCGDASLPARAEQGRGEKREGGREKRVRIQIKFSKNF